MPSTFWSASTVLFQRQAEPLVELPAMSVHLTHHTKEHYMTNEAEDEVTCDRHHGGLPLSYEWWPLSIWYKNPTLGCEGYPEHGVLRIHPYNKGLVILCKEYFRRYTMILPPHVEGGGVPYALQSVFLSWNPLHAVASKDFTKHYLPTAEMHLVFGNSDKDDCPKVVVTFMITEGDKNAEDLPFLNILFGDDGFTDQVERETSTRDYLSDRSTSAGSMGSEEDAQLPSRRMEPLTSIRSGRRTGPRQSAIVRSRSPSEDCFVSHKDAAVKKSSYGSSDEAAFVPAPMHVINHRREAPATQQRRYQPQPLIAVDGNPKKPLMRSGDFAHMNKVTSKYTALRKGGLRSDAANLTINAYSPRFEFVENGSDVITRSDSEEFRFKRAASARTNVVSFAPLSRAVSARPLSARSISRGASSRYEDDVDPDEVLESPFWAERIGEFRNSVTSSIQHQISDIVQNQLSDQCKEKITETITATLKSRAPELVSTTYDRVDTELRQMLSDKLTDALQSRVSETVKAKLVDAMKTTVLSRLPGLHIAKKLKFNSHTELKRKGTLGSVFSRSLSKVESRRLWKRLEPWKCRIPEELWMSADHEHGLFSFLDTKWTFAHYLHEFPGNEDMGLGLNKIHWFTADVRTSAEQIKLLTKPTKPDEPSTLPPIKASCDVGISHVDFYNDGVLCKQHSLLPQDSATS